MVRIHNISYEGLCHPRKWDWEPPGDQWCDMFTRKSHRCCTVSGRIPRVASVVVLGKRE